MFKNAIDGMVGTVADLDEHDSRIKEHEQKRKINQTQNLLNDTMYSTTTGAGDQFSQSRTIRGTEVGDETQTMAPTQKRAKDKEEYQRRKQEEEEMKRVLEEERQKQLDQYGGVDDNMKAIPF